MGGDAKEQGEDRQGSNEGQCFRSLFGRSYSMQRHGEQCKGVMRGDAGSNAFVPFCAGAMQCEVMESNAAGQCEGKLRGNERQCIRNSLGGNHAMGAMERTAEEQRKAMLRGNDDHRFRTLLRGKHSMARHGRQCWGQREPCCKVMRQWFRNFVGGSH